MDKLPYEELEKLVTDARIRIPAGSTWRHYKGTDYTIADIAIIEATNEVAVIYTSVDHPGVSFVRPVRVWNEKIEWNGHVVPRFSKLD